MTDSNASVLITSKPETMMVDLQSSQMSLDCILVAYDLSLYLYCK